ncbi:hypothetical protein KIPB_005501 [Kipferlia bialata]|uniref:Uncharacterized protein n=1 Tax=Kipferlia bialata TaxID=797122 RepID=A0A9K3CXI6_9EUKA|nr:hypothetical protein KIPB_005501 [Kipferlia bialata]|eukprot:g5501.t1
MSTSVAHRSGRCIVSEGPATILGQSGHPQTPESRIPSFLSPRSSSQRVNPQPLARSGSKTPLRPRPPHPTPPTRTHGETELPRGTPRSARDPRERQYVSSDRVRPSQSLRDRPRSSSRNPRVPRQVRNTRRIQEEDALVGIFNVAMGGSTPRGSGDDDRSKHISRRRHSSAMDQWSERVRRHKPTPGCKYNPESGERYLRSIPGHGCASSVQSRDDRSSYLGRSNASIPTFPTPGPGVYKLPDLFAPESNSPSDRVGTPLSQVAGASSRRGSRINATPRTLGSPFSTPGSHRGGAPSPPSGSPASPGFSTSRSGFASPSASGRMRDGEGERGVRVDAQQRWPTTSQATMRTPTAVQPNSGVPLQKATARRPLPSLNPTSPPSTKYCPSDVTTSRRKHDGKRHSSAARGGSGAISYAHSSPRDVSGWLLSQ